jgi:hypothetical protein
VARPRRRTCGRAREGGGGAAAGGGGGEGRAGSRGGEVERADGEVGGGGVDKLINKPLQLVKVKSNFDARRCEILEARVVEGERSREDMREVEEGFKVRLFIFEIDPPPKGAAEGGLRRAHEGVGGLKGGACGADRRGAEAASALTLI